MTNPAYTALVEKVARAMCERDGANWEAPDCNHTANGEEPEEQREYWLDKAQAAISIIREALQEPSDEMVEAGVNVPDVHEIDWVTALSMTATGSYQSIMMQSYRAMLSTSALSASPLKGD